MLEKELQSKDLEIKQGNKHFEKITVSFCCIISRTLKLLKSFLVYENARYQFPSNQMREGFSQCTARYGFSNRVFEFYLKYT